jgi:hypothetical protein
MAKNEFDVKFWIKQLGRRLEKYEYNIVNNALCEKEMNDSILDIAEYIKKDGLYIPNLSSDDGNCLFYSLCYLGLASDVDILKKGIVNLMIFFKNLKKFIPGQELSLEELFGFYNDIEFVYCKNNQKLYKYNYDTMCMDFLSKKGWKRINTELLLTIMSIALNIKFNIYHDNGHITKICPDERDNTQNIYLAQIGECHYIPLKKIEEKVNIEIPLYDEDIKKFIFWKKIIELENTEDEENMILSEDEFNEIYENENISNSDNIML